MNKILAALIATFFAAGAFAASHTGAPMAAASKPVAAAEAKKIKTDIKFLISRLNLKLDRAYPGKAECGGFGYTEVPCNAAGRGAAVRPRKGPRGDRHASGGENDLLAAAPGGVAGHGAS